MNGTITDVAGFNKVMNEGLDKIRGYSSEGIVQGAGGSTKLNYFYRAGLEDFQATTAERYVDKLNKKRCKVLYMAKRNIISEW